MSEVETSAVASEIVFMVSEADEGGYVAEALGPGIVTEADDLATLRSMVREAVACHYQDAKQRPSVIRLHFVRDEIIAA